MKLLVNLIGGPGTGKSTTAAGVFFQLKSSKVNAELISEYAKGKTWMGDLFSLGVQPYITVKQLYSIERVRNKVDVAISDGFLLNGLMYPCKYVNEDFENWLVSAHRSFPNLNIFIDRDVEHHGYEAAGRSQDLEQAMEIDQNTLALLERLGEPYKRLKMGAYLVDEIIDLIEEKLYDKPKALECAKCRRWPAVLQSDGWCQCGWSDCFHSWKA